MGQNWGKQWKNTLLIVKAQSLKIKDEIGIIASTLRMQRSERNNTLGNENVIGSVLVARKRCSFGGKLWRTRFEHGRFELARRLKRTREWVICDWELCDILANSIVIRMWD